MRTEVRVGGQVEKFVKGLAPEPRRGLTRAIKGLAQGQGDVKLLEGRLAGYYRLRVANYRVIYHESARSGVRSLNCLYANYRSVVYEMFAAILAEQLTPEGPP